jgi:hypothetical protein
MSQEGKTGLESGPSKVRLSGLSGRIWTVVFAV